MTRIVDKKIWRRERGVKIERKEPKECVVRTEREDELKLRGRRSQKKRS